MKPQLFACHQKYVGKERQLAFFENVTRLDEVCPGCLSFDDSGVFLPNIKNYCARIFIYLLPSLSGFQLLVLLKNSPENIMGKTLNDRSEIIGLL
ncbi:hypothetical protein MO867_09765 [Microbulbifer sp. OS29]|uniref:Uncharacterized protein n=1 Tax=Microbulbifer okhotskensis TaxID=2926617 RepID=A0A9X2ENX2_9GAMM|nr:hypothetical protein [Microbulbifer okhotskensis]MCO1334625.1 hypothetical protein [Microbulbifer okhotskensis]